jgi:hypothetical protein
MVLFHIERSVFSLSGQTLPCTRKEVGKKAMSFLVNATRRIRLPVDSHSQMNGGVGSYNQPRNRVYDTVRAQLHVSQNIVTEQFIVGALDTQDLLNTQEEGVRIIDQRIGNGRYAVDERQALVEGTTPQTFGPSATLSLPFLFDNVLISGIGISQTAISFPASSIPVPDTGIYAFSVVVSLPAVPALTATVTYSIRLLRVSPSIIASDADIITEMIVTRVADDPEIQLSMNGTQVMNMINQNYFSLNIVRENAGDEVDIDAASVRVFMLAT